MIDAYEKSKTRDNHIFRHAPEQYSRFAHTSLTHSTTRERERDKVEKCSQVRQNYMYLVLPPSVLSEKIKIRLNMRKKHPLRD